MSTPTKQLPISTQAQAQAQQGQNINMTSSPSLTTSPTSPTTKLLPHSIANNSPCDTSPSPGDIGIVITAATISVTTTDVVGEEIKMDLESGFVGSSADFGTPIRHHYQTDI